MPALLSPQPQVLNRGVRISITSVRCQSAIPITIRSHNLLHRQGFIAKHSLPVRNSLSTGSARSLTCLSIQKQLIKQFVIKLLFSVTSRRNQQASTPHSLSLRRKSAFGLAKTLTFELCSWKSFQHAYSHDEYLCASVNKIPPRVTRVIMCLSCHAVQLPPRRRRMCIHVYYLCVYVYICIFVCTSVYVYVCVCDFFATMI